jgi:hypothetical protein
MKTRMTLSWVLGLVLFASVPTIVAQDTTKSSSAVLTGQVSSGNQAAGYQSPWFVELSKLAQAGIEDRVLLAFVDSAGTFNLRPEQIIRLRDLGVSSDVINGVLQHDSEIALGLRQVPASTTPDSSSALEKLLLSGNGTQGAGTARSTSAATSKAAEPTATPASATGALAGAAPSGPLEVASSNEEGVAPTLSFAEPVRTTASPKELSPVRKPYPEQLTNPIIVVKAAGRMPNLVVIEGFADTVGP